MKAIETHYKGCRFRSRLEARWAVFFDSLGLRWQYEPNGVVLPGGTPYLPDFYLPELRRWVEVKPPLASADAWPEHPVWEAVRFFGGEWSRAIVEQDPAFAELLDGFILVAGEPYVEGSANDRGFSFNEALYQGFVFGDNGHYFQECLTCGKIGFGFGGEDDRVGCKCGGAMRGAVRSPRLCAAYRAARSARFERGESGPSGAEEMVRDARRLLGAGADAEELKRYLGTDGPQGRA